MLVLCEQLFDDRAVADDRNRPAGVAVVFLGVVDTQVVIERGSDVVGREALVLWEARIVVAFAHELTTRDTPAGHQHEHTSRIVIATTFFGALIDLRSSAKFTGNEDSR